MKFLIYGATKGRGDGIGADVAAGLSARGHEVMCFCRDPAKAAAQTDLRLEAVDLLSRGGQDRIKRVIREFDPDAIWSACGCGFGDPLWMLNEDQISDMMEANVRNNVLFCRTCGPSCLDGGPHLILTGSTAGVLSNADASVYSGMKGFLIPFVRGLRVEFARQGNSPKISVLLLSPVRKTGLDIVTDSVEFIARQATSMEVLIS